jgi:hypothetical protein
MRPGPVGPSIRPADEITHPLEARSGGLAEPLLGWSGVGNDAAAGIVPAREGEPWPN